jgi:hypothetical protein
VMTDEHPRRYNRKRKWFQAVPSKARASKQAGTYVETNLGGLAIGTWLLPSLPSNAVIGYHADNSLSGTLVYDFVRSIASSLQSYEY